MQGNFRGRCARFFCDSIYLGCVFFTSMHGLLASYFKYWSTFTQNIIMYHHVCRPYVFMVNFVAASWYFGRSSYALFIGSVRGNLWFFLFVWSEYSHYETYFTKDIYCSFSTHGIVMFMFFFDCNKWWDSPIPSFDEQTTSSMFMKLRTNLPGYRLIGGTSIPVWY